MNKKIFIKTFGCQMNEYDSNRIFDSLSKIGFKTCSNAACTGTNDPIEDCPAVSGEICYVVDSDSEKDI